MGHGNLVLIGFMGSGKTTVGRLIARATGLAFVDTDDEIARRAGRPVRAVFAEEGEEAFRKVEAEVVKDLAAREGQVIATGGGVVLQEQNLANLRRTGLVVALTAQTDVLWERVGTTDRPLLATDRPRERFAELLRLREPLYAAADVAVDTTGRSPDEVAATVAGHWRLANAARVPVSLPGSPYVVHVGAGLLSAVGAAAREAARSERAVVVADAAVNALYGDAVRRSLQAAGRQVEFFLVPSGEEAKRLSVIEALYQQAVRLGVEREDLVVALGGGTTGDCAGFFAATYLRGLPLLQVPTTLLAQVDASVGGKVGVNLEQGKNLVGAFYQPRAVVADTETLRSLPARELRSGLAEVVKCGVLADPELFARLERWGTLPEGTGCSLPEEEVAAAVRAAVTVKAEVVARDERESGPRMALNLGHTAAHAVETVTGFGPVCHGEAVAYGLSVATRLAVRLELCSDQAAERILALLRRLGLPRDRAELPVRVGVDDLLQALTLDKKVRRGRVRWVLPRRIGEVTITDEVPESLVRECL